MVLLDIFYIYDVVYPLIAVFFLSTYIDELIDHIIHICTAKFSDRLASISIKIAKTNSTESQKPTRPPYISQEKKLFHPLPNHWYLPSLIKRGEDAPVVRVYKDFSFTGHPYMSHSFLSLITSRYTVIMKLLVSTSYLSLREL